MNRFIHISSVCIFFLLLWLVFSGQFVSVVQSFNVSISTGAKVQLPVTEKLVKDPKYARKNYAGTDCGAKILSNSPEVENARAVLTRSRDEYLLSSCSSDVIRFVIELCDTVRVNRIEIANFELFSSSPKDFRVFMKQEYPKKKSDDWTLLGSFTAANERTVHSFPVKSDMFGKFIKVEVVSHYGKQHYCPISQFAVYGISEYESLQKIDKPTSTEPDIPDKVTIPDIIETSEKQQNQTKTVIETASDFFVNIVKNFVNGRPAGESKNETEPVIVPHFANESALGCQCERPFIVADLAWLPQSQGDSIGDQCFGSQEVRFANAVWGENLTRAMCHSKLFSCMSLAPISDSNQTTTSSNHSQSVAVEEPRPTGGISDILADLAELDRMYKLMTFCSVNASAGLDEAPVKSKESALVRLSNRIKQLESNMWLCSKNVEHSNNQHRATLQILNQTLKRVEAQYAMSLLLQDKIDNLRATVDLIRYDNNELRHQVVWSRFFNIALVLLLALAVYHQKVISWLRQLGVKFLWATGKIREIVNQIAVHCWQVIGSWLRQLGVQFFWMAGKIQEIVHQIAVQCWQVINSRLRQLSVYFLWATGKVGEICNQIAVHCWQVINSWLRQLVVYFLWATGKLEENCNRIKVHFIGVTRKLLEKFNRANDA